MTAKSEKGFTLMEIIVILAVVAVLAAVLTPMVVQYLEDSKKVKAESDVRQLAAAINKFFKDTGRFPFFKDQADSARDFKVLKGPGTYPTLGTSGWPADATIDVDTFDGQLQRNTPAYPTTGRLAWKGPYLNTLTEDAWGNAYVANVEHLQSGVNNQVWVISPGPNGTIDTAYSALSTAAAILSGDDIGARVK